MSKADFTLAVADRSPFRNQARALQQFASDISFHTVPIETLAQGRRTPETGPYIALVDESFALPLFGLSAIVEALNRRFPGRYLPEDAVQRARSRGVAQIIEQRLSYYLLAGMVWQRHGRSSEPEAQDAGALVLTTPPPLASIDSHHAQPGTRFIAGDRPSLADCHLAALWWTAEDLNLADELQRMPALARWHTQNCKGAPFSRA